MKLIGVILISIPFIAVTLLMLKSGGLGEVIFCWGITLIIVFLVRWNYFEK